MYQVASDEDKRNLLKSLIQEIHMERKRVKAIHFRYADRDILINPDVSAPSDHEEP
jgi:hypothetical protein